MTLDLTVDTTALHKHSNAATSEQQVLLEIRSSANVFLRPLNKPQTTAHLGIAVASHLPLAKEQLIWG